MVSSNVLTSVAAALPSTEPEPALVVLDRSVVAGAGTLFVRAVDAPALEALAHHLTRRAHAAGRPVVGPVDPGALAVAREVAQRLGVTSSALDAAETAHRIALAASARRAVVLVPLAAACAWDVEVARALSRELAAGDHAALAVVTHRCDVAGLDPSTKRIELGERLSPAELASVWGALAHEGAAVGPHADLVALDRWWSASRDAEASAPGVAAVSPEARRLLERLSLGRRTWTLDELAPLGPRAVLDELVARGLVVSERAGICVSSPGRTATDGVTVEQADLVAVAAALRKGAPADPWALARAGDLFAQAGCAEAAEEANEAALAVSDDPTLRADVTRSFRAAIAHLPADRAFACRLRAATSSLARGDTEAAFAWARDAAEAAPERYEALVLVGRTALARGDLVTASVALEKAAERAGTDGERARVALDAAETRYAAGDLDGAELAASEASSFVADAATRLGARNVLGKLLLAKGRWSEAEVHFAADELEASCAGESIAALRARLNRAIAVMSSGRNDEARPMLEGVLAEGQSRGETRAVAFALSNLAVLAILRHDYADALEHAERSIDVRRRLGDKIGLARAIINLAELRARLGLYAEAEQALAFARQAMSPGMPASRVTEAALVAASVHLARGRTLDASRELARALSHATAASDGEKLAECHRLGARIALEDGDVARAIAEVARAREHGTSTRARAEAALLHAMCAQAAGDELADLASEALRSCREADDENLLREAHLLSCDEARSRGDAGVARSHLDAAVALRDAVAARLPPALRRSYLSRRDLTSLAALEASPPSDEPDPPAPARSPTRSRKAEPAARVLVGEDPAIRGLLIAIRKVARSDSTVLIRGESGTGKELVAEAIHAASGRAVGPLVKVNCGALVETLLLSELFGHEKGAFTGAASRRRGRFELADGGTLFLDEIGDISPRTQVALLRVLQERTFERVGGTTPIRADVRIVCATHRDLRAMVERGEFREDLYYRLRGVTLELPPLRARMGDLPLVTASLLERIATERREAPKQLTADALALLGRHRWPGNVRELENALRAATLFAEGERIETHDLADNVDGLRALVSASLLPCPTSADVELEPSASSRDDDPPLPTSEAGVTEAVYVQVRGGNVSLSALKRQIERDCIARALSETRGNITRAASLLGMKRPRLSQLVKQYGLAAVSEAP